MKSTYTVKSLRQSGYKVRVMHGRVTTKCKRIGGFSQTLSPCGGSTVIEITTPEGITVVGKAECSMLDNFNRKVGNQIAIGRAMEKLASSND
jgi:hypothetical protein